ncbi:MAG: hypothetical protein JXR18_04490 [Neptuniibacter sp.]
MPNDGNLPVKYNTVFEKLVLSASSEFDEIVGAMAYVEYKKYKRSFVAECSEPPSAKDLDIFVRSQEKAFVFENHRRQAEIKLTKFGETFSEERVRKAKQRAQRHAIISEVEKLAEGVEKKITNELQPVLENTVRTSARELIKKAGGFWKGVFASITASVIIFALLTVLSIANPETGYAKIFQAVVFDKGIIQVVPRNGVLDDRSQSDLNEEVDVEHLKGESQ